MEQIFKPFSLLSAPYLKNLCATALVCCVEGNIFKKLMLLQNLGSDKYVIWAKSEQKSS